MDWRLRLPWLLIGMAHVDEHVARDIARQAVQQFSQDPRRRAHHRKTWEYLASGRGIRREIDKFVVGTSRRCLSFQAQSKIAELRFIPSVETVIEEKHARVSIEGLKTLGPVRVSLAHRLTLLETRVKRDPGYISCLIESFELAVMRERSQACLDSLCIPQYKHTCRRMTVCCVKYWPLLFIAAT